MSRKRDIMLNIINKKRCWGSGKIENSMPLLIVNVNVVCSVLWRIFMRFCNVAKSLFFLCVVRKLSNKFANLLSKIA
jgi:hypothetical protein